MRYGPTSPPIPIPEDSLPPGSFDSEPWDKNIPRGGFIEDFVLGTRGIETPTKFAVWAALYTISALLKRDAYMEWYPRPMFPNIFLIVVAPPRICAKSTCVDIGEDILMKTSDEYDDELIKQAKKISAHHSKATPEVLFDLMKPKSFEVELTKPQTKEEFDEVVEGFLDKRDDQLSEPTKGESKDVFESVKTSELSLIISELTTFLGKQKYTEHLVDILTYFYDCPDRADEATRTYGSQTLENVYLTFFGATTPDSFNKSLPETAFGGGFLSRTILVANYLPTRYHPIPELLAGAPGKKELAERLAWVGATAMGAYKFSKEAYDEYVSWYKEFKDSLIGDPLGDARARMDTNLVKLCVLLRAQRYQPGFLITKSDFLSAKFLLEDAFESSKELYTGASGSEYYAKMSMVTSYLQAHPEGRSRAQLLRVFMARQITPDVLSQILTHLLQSEQIEVIFGGEKKDFLTERPTEHIQYIGDKTNDTD